MKPQDTPSALEQWLDERFKISFLKKWLGKKEVPQHNQSMWYYFGGVALFFLVVQIITGLLLLVYYQPGLETSHTSVKFITEVVEYGWLVRSLHSWAANMMVAALFIHMFSAFFMKAFRAPREFTWLTGVLLFVITLGLGFSGYLLPWDELSYFATKIGIQIMQATPIIGGFMADLLRGGPEVGGATISRFFELHIILLPAALMGLLVNHLLMVQVHGMSKPYSYANRPVKHQKSISFMGEFLYHDLIIWSVLMGVLLFISWNFPWGLGEQADPFKPAPVGIKPEWYFMFMFQTLKQLPAHIGPFEGEVVGIMAFAVGGILWALVPFYENINKTVSKVVQWIGVFIVAFIIVMTAWGYMEEPEAPLTSATIGVPTSVADTSATQELFQQSCAACHSIGKGALAGPDLKGITDTRDREQLANFIVNPAGSKMPVLPGIDKSKALELLDYIEKTSHPEKATEAQVEAPKAILTPSRVSPETIENGRKLFLGIKPFAKGGAACISCHSAGSATQFGGGSLGMDLSGVYQRFGGRPSLEAWLASIPSPTMQPIYKNQPLQKEEVDAMVAFFEELSTQSSPTTKSVVKPPAPGDELFSKKSSFFILGLLGMFSILGIFSMVYNNRLQGVRKPLIKEALEKNAVNKGDTP